MKEKKNPYGVRQNIGEEIEGAKLKYVSVYR